MPASSTPLIRQEKKNQEKDHRNFSPASWVNITQDQALHLNALSQDLRWPRQLWKLVNNPLNAGEHKPQV